jgi:hypothetical protein
LSRECGDSDGRPNTNNTNNKEQHQQQQQMIKQSSPHTNTKPTNKTYNKQQHQQPQQHTHTTTKQATIHDEGTTARSTTLHAL